MFLSCTAIVTMVINSRVFVLTLPNTRSKNAPSITSVAMKVAASVGSYRVAAGFAGFAEAGLAGASGLVAAPGLATAVGLAAATNLLAAAGLAAAAGPAAAADLVLAAGRADVAVAGLAAAAGLLVVVVVVFLILLLNLF